MRLFPSSAIAARAMTANAELNLCVVSVVTVTVVLAVAVIVFTIVVDPDDVPEICTLSSTVRLIEPLIRVPVLAVR
jgi:hypothetical protein